MRKNWNTWNVRSVLSHVLLPEGISVSLGIKEFENGNCLREALIGRFEEHEERIIPGPHAYDGSFTSLEITWKSTRLKVETATDGDDWHAVITPLEIGIKTPLLTVEAAILWNRSGYTQRDKDRLMFCAPSGDRHIYTSGTIVDEPVVEISCPYLAISLDKVIHLSTDSKKLQDVSQIVAKKKSSYLKGRASRGDQQEVYDAMQICMAWDTIYDPFKDRIISPVSRIWCGNSGGWVLFAWDTYFAAWMAGMENKEIAYANAIAITEEATEEGFIPNFAHPGGYKSRDRSQPPVGSLTVKAICEMYDEYELAAKLFPALLKWNRWWKDHRDHEGYLCWGSTPYEAITGTLWEKEGVNDRYGGALESGLDNSPLYDDIPFDQEKTHLLMLADVGLMSLYISDCRALGSLASKLGHVAEADELNERAERYAKKLEELWDEDFGLYLNKDLTTGKLSKRISPTNFYPMLAEVPSQKQAERMVNEHFFNPKEFWGEWILPSIARNDPAYPDQTYWRGRIWAPMNFLVYLSLRNYDLPEARQSLAEKSSALLLKEWREHGHVHENYNGNTGEGCDVGNSDKFYHWGGLLGLIAIMEKA